MKIKEIIYSEPPGYFSPEMLEAAEKWDREHQKEIEEGKKNNKNENGENKNDHV